MKWSGYVKGALVACGSVLLCLPLAFMATVLSAPFWRWIEARFGIEAYGHSGPAEWCYWLVYVVLVVACLGTWLLVGGARPGSRRQSGSGSKSSQS